MGTTNLIIIVAAEAVALCLFAVAILVLKNRKLRRLVRKLQRRLEELVAQARQKPPEQPQPTPAEPEPSPASPSLSYHDYIEAQMEQTKDYHYELGSRQDIALDLDPDAPLQRRTAALRNAFLIAELEASSNEDQFAWDTLATRYQQILSFNEDYTPDDDNSDFELQQLREELSQAQKRINNLERFKTLFFELEEQWDNCQDKANKHYAELQTLAEGSDQKEDFDRILGEYQTSYQAIGAKLEKGIDDNLDSSGDDMLSHKMEIRRLREVASDQHRIIQELQNQLSSATTTEEKTRLVEGLQSELQKQSRFLQESETCIKLMEDELKSANQEIEMLKSRAVQVPQLKATLKELQTSADTREQIVDSLKTENRRLAKKLKLAQEGPPEDSKEMRTLRTELTNMQAKYNDLEEKFLNLKLKG